jgi:hypothetical protein
MSTSNETPSQQDRVDHPADPTRARRRRARSRRPSIPIPWRSAFGGSRALWIVLAVIALVLLVFLAAGPVVNINHFSITL